jgi:gliding motility-associated-like protein
MKLTLFVKYIVCFFLFTWSSFYGLAGPATYFIENKGQWHPDVLFKAAIPGGDLYVLKNKMKYVFYDPRISEHGHSSSDHEDPALRSNSAEGGSTILYHAVEVAFVGANIRSNAQGEKLYFSNLNYIKQGGHSASGVRSFVQVKINELYEGIDLVLYSGAEGLKYDLIVRAGANPSTIKLQYDGQEALFRRDKSLVIKTIFGEFTEHIPLVYQNDGAKKADVKATFKLKGNHLQFHLPEGFDEEKDLIIDPELVFSTYSGSTADNWGFTATYDDDGNLYSGGIVADNGFPVTNGVFQPTQQGGAWDVGILKYDPSGKTLIWATYIGGSFSETPQSLIVNSQGELVVFGVTSSADFPMLSKSFNGVFLGGDPIRMDQSGTRLVNGIPMENGTDIFVAKLSADGGSLAGATFIGGTDNDGIIERFTPLVKNYGDQFRGEVNLDKDDNIYIASSTSSADFLIRNGAGDTYGGGESDGIVAKFDPELSDLEWSTFVGGSGMDALYSVKLDGDGFVYAAGGSTSVDFPATEGALKTEKTNPNNIDGAVMKLSGDGSKVEAATYLGTAAYDQVYFVEIDSSNRVYVLGQTTGEWPVTGDVFFNPGGGQFIQKIGSNLDTTFFSTTIGSGGNSPNFSPTAFLINECENIFVSGWGGNTNSGAGYLGGSTFGLPVTDDAFQSQTDGSDFYLIVLLQDAKQLLYGTFFGEFNQTQGGNEHVDGGTSRFDKRGIVYQAVCGGCGGSSAFPTWPPDVWSNTNNASNCNNAAFKFNLASLEAIFETDNEDFTDRGVRDGCYPLTIVFLNESLGGLDFQWSFGEGTVTNQQDSITITYPEPGVYPVELIATDINTCVRESRATGAITVYDYDFEIMPDDSICFGESITLRASGGEQYNWTPETSLINSSTARPVATPDSTTIYTLQVVDRNGCFFEDSVLIEVLPRIVADFELTQSFDFFDVPEVQLVNLSENASIFTWDFGDGTKSDELEPSHKYQGSDSIKTYQVELTATESFCSSSKREMVTSVTPFVPNFVSPNGDGKNDVFEVRAVGEVQLRIYNRSGGLIYENSNYKNDWDFGDHASGTYFYEIVMGDKSTRCKGWVQVMY